MFKTINNFISLDLRLELIFFLAVSNLLTSVGFNSTSFHSILLRLVSTQSRDLRFSRLSESPTPLKSVSSSASSLITSFHFKVVSERTLLAIAFGCTTSYKGTTTPRQFGFR
ncbi:hypothetical protein B9Z55_022515 [Caenorhabditis nigoni]|uniref:Uncharacterized protein n=1 Tax=Caenorhabditis nigoni TaxID=1611254 RepID=A0A2G5SKZ2_9PELO|nr:hypothetical protein B9Z55_022515 [Caenorhabditis nigoni]